MTRNHTLVIWPYLYDKRQKPSKRSSRNLSTLCSVVANGKFRNGSSCLREALFCCVTNYQSRLTFLYEKAIQLLPLLEVLTRMKVLHDILIIRPPVPVFVHQRSIQEEPLLRALR